MKNEERVLVIGIDSGTFDIINPMVQRGELPIPASLMGKGVWGKLVSTSSFSLKLLENNLMCLTFTAAIPMLIFLS